jgi:hypothetical protein
MSEASSGPSNGVGVHHCTNGGGDHGGHKRLRADHPPDEPQPAVVGSVSASPEASLDGGAAVDGVEGAGARALPDARGGGSSMKAEHKKRPGTRIDLGTRSGPELLRSLSDLSCGTGGHKRLRSDSPLLEPLLAPKPAARRFAFVAGNHYSAPSPNTVEVSCRAVAAALADSGFTVEICLGRDKRRFDESFDGFVRSLSPNCEVILFLAGRSVESDGDCFFIPEDRFYFEPADLCMYGLPRMRFPWHLFAHLRVLEKVLVSPSPLLPFSNVCIPTRCSATHTLGYPLPTWLQLRTCLAGLCFRHCW